MGSHSYIGAFFFLRWSFIFRFLFKERERCVMLLCSYLSVGSLVMKFLEFWLVHWDFSQVLLGSEVGVWMRIEREKEREYKIFFVSVHLWGLLSSKEFFLLSYGLCGLWLTVKRKWYNMYGPNGTRYLSFMPSDIPSLIDWIPPPPQTPNKHKKKEKNPPQKLNHVWKQSSVWFVFKEINVLQNILM